MILLALGISLEIADIVAFSSRFNDYSEAIKQWTESNITATVPPPQPSAYGLDNTSIILSGILGWAGSLLILISVLYLGALLYVHISNQRKKQKKQYEFGFDFGRSGREIRNKTKKCINNHSFYKFSLYYFSFSFLC